MNKIDTTTDYEINTPPSQSATVEMMSFLIKREVSDKMWTPNLPFIFPSYVLDNMPNFQLGLMSAVSNVSSSFAAKVDQTIAPEKELPLKTAAELLKYPGTIWMFSPQNKLLRFLPPTPSTKKPANSWLLTTGLCAKAAASSTKAPETWHIFCKECQKTFG